MRIVYSPRYNIGGYGIEKLHLFDGSKYANAWQAIEQAVPNANAFLLEPREAVSHEVLRLVHADDYLQQLGTAKYLAKVFASPSTAWIPMYAFDSLVLEPMRVATQGTILAADAALEHGLAVNLGGGYHHAKPASGEGFHVYNDVALAIAQLRASGRLNADDTILYVDCDAHHGNGVCTCFLGDRTVKIFDICNAQIYPRHDRLAKVRIDKAIRLSIGANGESYLLQLQQALPPWIDEVIASRPPALAIYNAGTDVVTGDLHGALDLRPPQVLERDVFVVESLRSRGIPTVMVLGGGYTAQSYRLVADSVVALAQRYG